MKKIGLFFLLLCIPLMAFADGRAIKTANVFLCDGKYYGYHGEDNHYHIVSKKGNTWYPVGNKVDKPACEINPVKESINLVSCVDGDTAKFTVNGEVKTIRFLAIDTPETVHPTKKVELFGKEASNFTCNSLKNAKEIVIEYDANSQKIDKYDRLLGWIFVDGKLLQQELVSNGYAEVTYLYDDYKYTPLLQDMESVAKREKLGIWGEYKSNETDFLSILKKIWNKILHFLESMI